MALDFNVQSIFQLFERFIFGFCVMAKWREIYHGGSPESELREFQVLARDIMAVQLTTKRRAGARTVDRAFHANARFATTHGRLRILRELPADLSCEWIEPEREYDVFVRFSNASGAHQSDDKPDLRGLALRVFISDGVQHDLLMTNYPVSYARNARQVCGLLRDSNGGRTALRARRALHRTRVPFRPVRDDAHATQRSGGYAASLEPRLRDLLEPRRVLLG